MGRITLLRERALASRPSFYGLTTLLRADAYKRWGHLATERNWPLWRARCVQHVLENVPMAVAPEERIVGRIPVLDHEPWMEQRVRQAEQVLSVLPPWPGGDRDHFAVDFEKVFSLGIGGLLAGISSYKGAARDADKRMFYESCEVAVGALGTLVGRFAAQAREAAHRAGEEERRAELTVTENTLRNLISGPPRTFREALQLMLLTMLALNVGERHILNVPGRPDRTLHRFYAADVQGGRLTRQDALELICEFYIQMNNYTPRGLAQSVMVGGTDSADRDVTNELSYLFVEALKHVRLAYPTVGICWNEQTPEELVHLGCELIREGLGSPAFFNDRLIARGLQGYGVSPKDSHSYVNSTCVEITTIGNSNQWVASPYYNVCQSLLNVMRKARDGELAGLHNTDELIELVTKELRVEVTGAAAELSKSWEARKKFGLMPLQSALTADCLARGLDIDREGARYNWVECSFVGLANLADSLAAIDKLCFEDRELSVGEFYDLLERDLEGCKGLRERILNSMPKYGNDDEKVDALAARLTSIFAELCRKTDVAGHPYVPGLFCWIMHDRLGAQTIATADGRLAGKPFADGAGPAQGRERRGPTAAVKSCTRWDHTPMIGGLVLNLKFSPKALERETGLRALADLIRTYMRLGGFEVQVNVVSSDVLEEARLRPDEHKDLLVRVAGYSDYFVNLTATMQDELVARTEFGEV